MLEILSATSALFITILLGFIAGFVGIFKRGEDKVLINYVFYFALPLNLFLSCYKATWQIFDANYLISYSLSMIIIITLTYWLSKKIIKVKRQESLINTLAVSQVDGAYFTIPLFLVVFQSSALAVPLMLVQNVIFFTAGLILLQLGLENRKRQSSYFVFIFSRVGHVLIYNPLISLSLLGLLFNFSKIPLPSILLQDAHFIGKTASCVALFSLGLTCSFYIKELKQVSNIILLTLLSSLKLIVFPIIALLIGTLLHLPRELKIALVLLTASPAATHTYIVANKYEVDAQVPTFNVVITTILSFITINSWLYLLKV